jgi:hypothetical protein
MAGFKIIQIPDQIGLEWLIENQADVARIMRAAQLNATMKVFLIRAGIAQFNAQDPIQRGEQAFTLNLPIFYAKGVPDDLPPGATLADVIAAHNALLAQERTVQVLPTSSQ